MSELIEKIDGVIEGRLLPMDLTDEDFKAIRALIIAVGEWQKEAMDICAEPGNYDLADRLNFIKKIRDFDFGKEPAERKEGKSKLVYDRKTRTIVKVTPEGKKDSGLKIHDE